MKDTTWYLSPAKEEEAENKVPFIVGALYKQTRGSYKGFYYVLVNLYDTYHLINTATFDSQWAQGHQDAVEYELNRVSSDSEFELVAEKIKVRP